MTKHAHVIDVTDATFEELVLKSDRPVLMEMSGAWCPPCRVLEPIVARLAEEVAGKVTVVKIDVNESPGVARRFAIRGVPTTIALEGGVERGRILGLTTREALLRMLGSERGALQASPQRPAHPV